MQVKNQHGEDNKLKELELKQDRDSIGLLDHIKDKKKKTWSKIGHAKLWTAYFSKKYSGMNNNEFNNWLSR